MAVERSRWTDERLDNLVERVMRQDVLEVRMDALERGLSEFRAEMKTELRDLRADLGSQLNSLRSELYTTKRRMMGLWLSGALGFAAIIIEIVLQR
jgi:hypothetical protein